MRKFHGLLFLGMGEDSNKLVVRLHQRLNEGLLVLGGAQQMHSRSERDEDLLSDIEDVVRDIAAALLGKETTFGGELPYPWNIGELLQGMKDDFEEVESPNKLGDIMRKAP